MTIVGKVIGKTTTSEFEFITTRHIRKFEYITVMHRDRKTILCQIIELTRDTDKTIAKAIVIGYKNNLGLLKPIRTPVEPGTDVFLATEEYIKEMIKIKDTDTGAFIGHLEGKKIKVSLDLKKLLTKHVAVLAKSGAGKSYTVGAIVEEVMEKNVPLLIIDPHGEYSQMKFKNDNKNDIKTMKEYAVKPKAYNKHIQEYGDTRLNSDLNPLKLNERMDNQELMHLLPKKLSNNQMAILFSALKNLDGLSLTQLLLELEVEENSAKWGVISVVDYLKNLDIFSLDPTSYDELIQPGKCSIINLRGVDPYIQEIIVYKLLKDLFEERKRDKVPPFFVVVEEAHNYCPERSFGEKKSSPILRTVASEGRKFGMGLCVISQRPARIEKNVLSQCTTQIIMKVTNPNDLKAISNSVEGITSETESEIRNLPVGSALITGVVDIPLLVNIRPRKSKHGGETVDILKEFEEDKFFSSLKKFENKELLPIIEPRVSIKDLVLMSEKEVEEVKTYLIPAVMIKAKHPKEEISLLVDLMRGDIIKNIAESITVPVCKAENIYECRNFEKISYMETPYSKKMAKKLTPEYIMAQLKMPIVEHKECFVVFHQLVHKKPEVK